MWENLKVELKALWEEMRPQVRRALVRALSLLREGWHLIRPPIVFALQVLAALILLFEEWGWEPLVAALGRLARWKPWARFELWVAGLPPYGSLAVLAVPMATLTPIKFIALYLMAQGLYAWGMTVFIAAKLASTAFVARLFILTKPALMRIGWFAKAYDLVMPWQRAMFEMVRASWPWRYGRVVKMKVSHEAKQAWARWKPRIKETIVKLRLRALALAHALAPRLKEAVAELKRRARKALGRETPDHSQKP